MYKLILVILLLLILFLYFIRHPDNNIISNNINDNIVTSPAFGTIKKIIMNEDYVHIIIFLSITDVHVQYYPIRGTVINQVHDANGTFNLAYKLNKSNKNEKVITTIKPKLNIPNIYVYQIAGLIARRITTTLQYNNEDIEPTQKMGMILLGSRVDLVLPKEGLTILAKENQYVEGFNTVIAKYI